MPLNLLTDIPRELRDKIYMYVLACPSETNVIPLFPRSFRRTHARLNPRPYNPSSSTATSDNRVTINLSLLLTCKQIRRECKDCIWIHNGLWIPGYGRSELCEKLDRYNGFEQFYRIRCIIIRLELLDWDELEWIFQSLHPLIAAAKKGKLESIQLLAKTDRVTPMKDFAYLGNLRKNRECIDGRWYRAALFSGQQVRCQRKLVINTGWPRFSHEGKQKWIRELLVDEMMETDGLLEGLNGMFGGEVYVDEVLCFKNGRRIGKMVGWDPREGGVEIRPARSQDGDEQSVI